MNIVEKRGSDVEVLDRWFFRLVPLYGIISIILTFAFFLFYQVGFIVLLQITLLSMVWIFYPIYMYFKVKLFAIKFNQEDIWVKQGVLTKQEVNIPYKKVQNVIIERDLWDRILGTSRVIIENFGGDGLNVLKDDAFSVLRASGRYSVSKGYYSITPGIKGERLFIPGIKPKEAENIKICILSKIKNS